MLPINETGNRKLGSVPWDHQGYRGLTVHARQDVPAFDDSMIRAALLRGARLCEEFAFLDRALNRELWAFGYVARLERDVSDRSIVCVEIASGR
jgi:hypothetical protein